MPSTDKMAIGSEFLKKGRKLLPCQKEMIVWWHTNRGMNISDLSRMFHVSRRLISFTLDPEKNKRNLQARKNRGGNYDKEKNTADVKKYRQHKKQLFNNKQTKTTWDTTSKDSQENPPNPQ